MTQPRRRDEWLPNFYPPRRLASNQHLLVSRCGATATITDNEAEQLYHVYMDEQLFCRLERTGHIVTQENIAAVFASLRRWNEATYAGPTLHILSVTRRCNLNCTYCHMNPIPASSDRHSADMTLSTGTRIVDFALQSPNRSLSFEFQGGEPFLNFPLIQGVVEYAVRHPRSSGKSLRFSIVSNIMTVTERQLQCCRTLGLKVSYTLNGPSHVHDLFRVNWAGRGSHSAVRSKVQQLRRDFGDVISAYPLCVIDNNTASQLPAIIDYFYDLGFDGVALIRIKPLGSAVRNKMPSGGRSLIDAYIGALDYILEKNKRSDRAFSERMVGVALLKLFGVRNVGFVDWKNPSGDILEAITYDIDGEILPADEARSNRDIFSIGNVHQRTFAEVMHDEGTYLTVNASLRDGEEACRECAYNPYCGVMPVIEYARTGSVRPIPYESEDCQFTLAVMDWVVKRYLESPIAVLRMAGDVGDGVVSMLSDYKTSLFDD